MIPRCDLTSDATVTRDATCRLLRLTLLLAAAGWAVATSAADVFVHGANGNDANGGSSWADAKKTIQAAVNAVTLVGTIHVATGTYAESVQLKGGITLRGGYPATNSGTSLLGRDPVANPTTLDAGSASYAFAIVGDSVEDRAIGINGFVIRNAQNAAFQTDDPLRDFTFESNQVTGNYGGQVSLDGTVNTALLNGNTFTGNSHSSGVWVSGQSNTVTVTNNTIDEATGTDLFTGLQWDSPATNAVVRNNQVSGGGGPNVGSCGIQFWDTVSTFTIANNTITDMAGRGCFGIHLWDNASGGTVGDNVLTDLAGRGSNGIHFWYNATQVTVQGNTLTNILDGTAGIHFWGTGSSVTVSDNVLRHLNNCENGIVFWSAATNLTVANNTLEQLMGVDAYIGFWGSAQTIAVRGNVLMNFSDNPTPANANQYLRFAGIQLFRTATDVLIENNQLSDFSTAYSDPQDTVLGIFAHAKAVNVVIAQNTLRNLAGRSRDGLGFDYRSYAVSNCTIRENLLTNVTSDRGDGGGLMFLQTGTDCQVINNLAAWCTRGLHADTNLANTNVAVMNNTFYGNGTGVDQGDYDLDYRNNLICNSTGIGFSYWAASGPPVFVYNNVWGNGTNYGGGVNDLSGANGNLSAAPKLVDPNGADNVNGTADDNFALGAGSACIDAGTSDTTPATDFAVRARYDDPATPNTGGGTITYYDIGALEYQRALGPRSLDLSLVYGWNLVALPFTPDDTAPGTVFGSDARVVQLVKTPGTGSGRSIDVAYSYQDVSTLAAMVGYFVFIPDLAGRSVHLTGTLATTRTLELTAGWNMVGVKKETNIGALMKLNPYIRSVVTYNPVGRRYVAQRTMYATGKGYLVFVQRAITIVQ